MISLIQTAEGALNETHDILQRMRELAVQSSNDTNTDDDRAELQKEVNQLAEELTRIGENTEFNTKNLIDGEFSGKFQIGANEGQSISLEIGNMTAGALKVGSSLVAATNGSDKVLKDGDNVVGTWQDAKDAVEADSNANPPVEAKDATAAGYYKDDKLVLATDKALEDGKKISKGINISTQESADKAITTINDAVKIVSAERSKLGAYQNRLEHTINNLSTSSENLTAAESRIRDVDYALAA